MSTVETVSLTLPEGRRYVGLARLFVGGLAARLGLGYEAMDNLQLAVESVLLASVPSGEVSLQARIDAESMSIVVGPLDRDPFDSALPHAEALGLERLLAALVVSSRSYEEDGSCWLRLDVPVAAAHEGRA